MNGEIDIKGRDKAVILARLYNASRPQGLGFLHASNDELTVDEARELLKESDYFDYLYGRVLKVDLSGDTLRTRLYDRDNGMRAAARAIGESDS